MPPHAPCRLQRFINSTDEIEVHLCLHTPRADCNPKMQSRCARQVLCLHTPRADCNISPCVVKGKEYRLCLHTPRADCNEKRPRLSACSMPLPPHAPCRLQRVAALILYTPHALPPHAPCRLQPEARLRVLRAAALPPHAPCRLQRFYSLAKAHLLTLPPHAPCRLQRQKCTELQYALFRTCVESVDSFSVLNKAMLR